MQLYTLVLHMGLIEFYVIVLLEEWIRSATAIGAWGQSVMTKIIYHGDGNFQITERACILCLTEGWQRTLEQFAHCFTILEQFWSNSGASFQCWLFQLSPHSWMTDFHNRNFLIMCRCIYLFLCNRPCSSTSVGLSKTSIGISSSWNATFWTTLSSELHLGMMNDLSNHGRLYSMYGLYAGLSSYFC